MTPDEIARHIPPEVVEAAWEAYIRDGYRPSAFKSALAAGLAAWPNATRDELMETDEPFLILPLPQEPGK